MPNKVCLVLLVIFASINTYHSTCMSNIFTNSDKSVAINLDKVNMVVHRNREYVVTFDNGQAYSVYESDFDMDSFLEAWEKE